MLTGRGFFIWQVLHCEGGDPQRIAREASAAGLRWAALKIADGALPSNRDPQNGQGSLLPPVAAALRAAGIAVWGWHYVYGYNPQAEAAVARAQIEALSLDGYIVDAEAEYKLPGRATAAVSFMEAVRAASPGLPVGICSYRYPALHPEFPWDEFLSLAEFSLPQVYWEGAHNPAAELARSCAEFAALPVRRPVLPVGPTYRTTTWAPTAADIRAFQRAASGLGLAGTGYFSWDECRRDLPDLWEAVREKPHRVFLPLISRGRTTG